MEIQKVEVVEQKQDPVTMWDSFRDQLVIKDRKYHFKTYFNCFIGSEAGKKNKKKLKNQKLLYFKNYSI